jgi:hypothetical protein
MSWRTVQLGQDLCDQDRLILDLFKDTNVRYIGPDSEFKAVLPHNELSTNLVLIINHQVWCSDIVKLVCRHLTQTTDKFYIGINRYYIKGNDTTEKFTISNHNSEDIVSMLTGLISKAGFAVTKSGHYDKDLGRHFNFVQPLTWIYGHRVEANTSN